MTFDFAFVYLYDILIASWSLTEHLQHLRTMFERLSSHKLVINPTKCEFGKPEVNFLTHTINAYGIRPHLTRVEALSLFPRLREHCISLLALSTTTTALFPDVQRSYSLYIMPLQPTVSPKPPLIKKPLTQLNVRCPRL